MNRKSLGFLFLILILSHYTIHAQVKRSSGHILSVSGQTVIAQFDNVSISIGDEVEIFRSQKIVDPVSNKVRGEQQVLIAKGLIVDFGLGKANLRVDEFGDYKVGIDDTVVLTGKEKKITREGPRFGEIQEISEDSIVTNLGSADEISEGDIFLIQRNEPIYDPETNEIIGTNPINVGRYSVDSVSDNSSVARILEQNMEPLKTDIVYKESDYLNYLATIHSDSAKIARLRDEVDTLKMRMESVQSKVDSLGLAHSVHLNDFEILKNDIETVLTRLMSGDFKEVKLSVKNDEPVTVKVPDNLLALYKQALDDCLDLKLQSAIQQFNSIIGSYPNSKLTENCRYWTAQSYFAMKAYPQATEGFITVINDKRFDHKDDDASIMLGITYFRMNKPDEARAEFQRFIDTYPESEYISKINFWVSQLSS